jgi:hypothetical protein
MYFQPIARRKGDIQLIAKLQENCKMEIKNAVKLEPQTRVKSGFFEPAPSPTTRDFESGPL